MEILQRDEDFRGEESDCVERQTVGRLLTEERMEVAVGTVIDQKAGVVRNIQTRVESREIGVIEHGEDLRLRFNV